MVLGEFSVYVLSHFIVFYVIKFSQGWKMEGGMEGKRERGNEGRREGRREGGKEGRRGVLREGGLEGQKVFKDGFQCLL